MDFTGFYVLIKKTNGKVLLYINKDTSLVLIEKNGKKYRLYFDTVRIEKGKIIGLKSRFIGNESKYNLDDIEKFEIHSELSKTEKVG